MFFFQVNNIGNMKCFSKEVCLCIAVRMCTISILWCILASFLGNANAEQIIHSFGGQIGAANYTYYKLSREGSLALILETLKGDADIYISDKTLLPTFEDFELHSTTCGEDRVDIPADFSRPIGVGVYGHPSHEQSIYRLSVVIDNDNVFERMTRITPEHERTKFHKSANHRQQTSRDHHSRVADNEEEESLLWTIFVSILKIVLDILV